MALPFNLQKLPPECLDLIHYMAQRGEAATTIIMESDSGMHPRMIGKAIRRLINGDYLTLDKPSGNYSLTDDGWLAAELIAQHLAEGGNTAGDADVPRVQRKLSIIGPRSTVAGLPTLMTIVANPPDSAGSGAPSEVILRLSATGGSLSASTLTLHIPMDAPSAPMTFNVVPDFNTPGLRIRVDAFQQLDLDRIEPLEAIYFDTPIHAQPETQDRTLRAVGLNMALQQV